MVIFGYPVEMPVFLESWFLDTWEVSNIGCLGPCLQGSPCLHTLFSCSTVMQDVDCGYLEAGWVQIRSWSRSRAGCQPAQVIREEAWSS